MNPGFVYVLANSAMPDLVKIGFTRDDPAQRAAQLSAVTGVPVPFILVYRRQVDDCEAAEQLLHAHFEELGMRVAGNREFFSAPVSDVVDAIVQLPMASAWTQPADGNRRHFSEFAAEAMWHHVWREAEALHFGLEGRLKDPEGALELYRKCVRLGSKWAHYRLCLFELSGAAETGNLAKLLKAVRAGEQKGNYVCFLVAARYYTLTEDDASASTAFEAFFRLRAKCLDPEMDEALGTVDVLARSLLRALHLIPNWSLDALRQLVSMRDALVQSYEDAIRHLEATGADLSVLGPYHEARYQIESI